MMKIEINITEENYEQIKKALSEFEQQPKQAADNWPMSVKDLDVANADFFSLDDGFIIKRNGYEYRFDSTDFDTERDAQSAHAFAQLSRMIRYINKGWLPDWKNTDQRKWFIQYSEGIGELTKYQTSVTNGRPDCLYFANEEDAERSMETHKELWLQYLQK